MVRRWEGVKVRRWEGKKVGRWEGKKVGRWEGEMVRIRKLEVGMRKAERRNMTHGA
jgi:hypothetical protein